MPRRVVVATALAAVLVLPGAEASAPKARDGGTFRVGFAQFDYVDPALAYSNEARAILDTTCARLMAYPDKPPPEGFRLVPELVSPVGDDALHRARQARRSSSAGRSAKRRSTALARSDGARPPAT